MLPHPHTIAVLKEMEHRQRLAEAAAARRAAPAQPVTGSGSSLIAAARRCLGTALVGVGTRLQGAQRGVHPAAGSVAAR